MGRHISNKKQTTDKFTNRKKLVYKTVIYPKIERHVSDIYIDVLQSDRLDNLAYKYYKDATLWWVIAEANKLGKGSMFIKPGRRIRLPHPEKIDSIVSKLYDAMEDRV